MNINRIHRFRFAMLLCTLLLHSPVQAEIDYTVNRVELLPQIDGVSEPLWHKAATVTLQDVVAKHELEFQAVHDGKSIAIKVRFPDATHNREHKTMLWNEQEQRYVVGPKREDAFVLKWAMSSLYRDISLRSDAAYTADVWYWKSFRTDPVGYADDKIQIYSKVPNSAATKIRSANGGLFFLQRKGDAGLSSYQTAILLEKDKPEMDQYLHRQPQGSRADIRAKGLWQDGYWIVEFLRKLQTGYSDDVQLAIGEYALLGLSRYEIAGRNPDETLEQPLFGSGDTGELIRLLVAE